MNDRVKVNIHDIIDSPYIYIDWNVVKYMKEPRSNCIRMDNECRETIYKLKRKYKFPFSEAHIQDRASKFREEYRDKVIEDFMFFGGISDNLVIGRCEEKDKFIMQYYNPMKMFNDEVEKIENKVKQDNLYTPQGTFQADMSKIGEDHPLYEMLKANNGLYTPTAMNDYIEKMFDKIFSDANEYKRFRNYIGKVNIDKNELLNQQSNLGDMLYAQYLYNHMQEFVKSMQYNREELKQNWENITKEYLSMSSTTNLSKEKSLIQGYMLLEMHPIFYDQLKNKKNTLDNIRRDAMHVYYASEAKYFISEDLHTREKTKFLYEVYNIKTKVVSEEEFLEYFC